MTKSDLKIAYLCDISPLLTLPYSGGNARIFNTLREHADSVTVLSDSWHLAEPVRSLILKMSEDVSLRLRWRAHIALSRIIARGLKAELAKGTYDVVFGAYSFHSMHRIQTPYPMLKVFTCDSTPTTYKQSEVGAAFGSYLKASRGLDPYFLAAETRVYNDMDLLLWPSDWLKQAADAQYGLDPNKSVVVPWGANVPDPGKPAMPSRLGKDAPVRLLLIGRDWWAKGGPLVFETLNVLRSRGVDARLTVIGTHPPDEHVNDAVTVLGHLDKSVPEELEQFLDALHEAHFIMQPSFESYGFAFCEASAYGIPSLCLRVGGVPVWDGVNGHALPQGSTAEDFADQTMYYLDKPRRYNALRLSSRDIYEKRLNWDAWGQRVTELMRHALDARKQGETPVFDHQPVLPPGDVQEDDAAPSALPADARAASGQNLRYR